MVGIIFIGDLLYCPYIEKYERLLKDENADYEIVFWNRSGFFTSEPGDRYVVFEKRSKLRKSKLSKLKDFIEYRKWLINVIRIKKYDKLILLSSLVGIILYPSVIEAYKEKYIFDIRDYSYEKIRPYYDLERKIIDNSAFTTVSSKGFLEFLPPSEKYVFTHNMSMEDTGVKHRFNRSKSDKLNFVWMGAVRYFQHQCEIVDSLNKDGRFNIIFHGEGPDLELFKVTAKQRGWENVLFTGKYDNKDKNKLLSEADILNNSYQLNQETKYAVSNKFYDGFIYHIPQLAEVGSYKESLVEKFPVGIALDVKDPEFASKLYNYYYNIDANKFDETCHVIESEIIKEEKYCIERIKQFILK